MVQFSTEKLFEFFEIISGKIKFSKHTGKNFDNLTFKSDFFLVIKIFQKANFLSC